MRNVLGAIGVVVLVGIVGSVYYIKPNKQDTPEYSEKTNPSAVPFETASPKKETPAQPAAPAPTAKVDWKTLIPAIRTELTTNQTVEFAHNVESSRPIAIYYSGDITGDGVPEALVYTGDGGASTDLLAVMQLQGGDPVVVSAKKSDGTMTTISWMTGGSVAHGDHIYFIPAKHGIVMGGWTRPSDTEVNCNLYEAYTWNPSEKMFISDAALASEMKTAFCKKATSQQPDDSNPFTL